jgi:hypothetical protein
MTALERNVPYADDTSTNPDALKDRSGVESSLRDES